MADVDPRLPSHDIEWSTEITETHVFERVKQLPKANIYRFLQ